MKSSSAQGLALQLGLDHVAATSVVPFLWFSPATSDPYSGPVMSLVQGIQQTLLRMGVVTRGDGFVDAATSQALAHIVGPRWKNLPWITSVTKLINAEANRRLVDQEFGQAQALGDVGSDGWCSSRFPKAGCSAVRGVCKPMDAATLGVFRDLQSQLNRVAVATGGSLIAVDGRIGADTLRSAERALRYSPTTMQTTFATCDDLAASADEVLAAARAIADGLNAPKTAPSARPKAPPSVALPGGQVMHPSDAQLSAAPLWLIFGGALAGGLLLFGTKKRKR